LEKTLGSNKKTYVKPCLVSKYIVFSDFLFFGTINDKTPVFPKNTQKRALNNLE
jgi:hypothetical protein